MRNPKQIWVLEYSERQGAYHISTLTESRRNTREARQLGIISDYKRITTCNSYDEANDTRIAHENKKTS